MTLVVDKRWQRFRRDDLVGSQCRRAAGRAVRPWRDGAPTTKTDHFHVVRTNDNGRVGANTLLHEIPVWFPRVDHALGSCLGLLFLPFLPRHFLASMVVVVVLVVVTTGRVVVVVVVGDASKRDGLLDGMNREDSVNLASSLGFVHFGMRRTLVKEHVVFRCGGGRRRRRRRRLVECHFFLYWHARTRND